VTADTASPTENTPTMSDKITLQNLSAEQEADRLLAEEDEASRNWGHAATPWRRDKNLKARVSQSASIFPVIGR
jgi:hypothetical protein